MKKRILCLVIAAVVVMSCLVGCESMDRELKTLDSEFGGGLNRTITIYDQNGQVIKQYKGKADIECNEYGNKVLFDINGKRVVTYNAVVIAEEN